MERRIKSEHIRKQLTLDIAHDLKNPLAVILNVGDRVRVTYTAGSEGSILTAGSVTAEGKTAESVLPPAQTDASEPDGTQAEQTPATAAQAPV